MQASPTAKLLKWGRSTQSVSHNGFGIDRSFASRTPNTNKPHSAGCRTAEQEKVCEYECKSHEHMQTQQTQSDS